MSNQVDRTIDFGTHLVAVYSPFKLHVNPFGLLWAPFELLWAPSELPWVSLAFPGAHLSSIRPHLSTICASTDSIWSHLASIGLAMTGQAFGALCICSEMASCPLDFCRDLASKKTRGRAKRMPKSSPKHPGFVVG